MACFWGLGTVGLGSRNKAPQAMQLKQQTVVLLQSRSGVPDRGVGGAGWLLQTAVFLLHLYIIFSLCLLYGHQSLGWDHPNGFITGSPP